MAINFDKPVAKPQGNQSEATVGPQSAEVAKVEMKTSKNGNEYLSVWLKLDKGGMIFDSFFDSEKEFPIYKLMRFLAAVGVELTGSLGLKEIAKFIKVKTKLDVVVAIDDKGYAMADFSKSNEGYYQFGFFNEIENEKLPFDADDSTASETVEHPATTEEDY